MKNIQTFSDIFCNPYDISTSFQLSAWLKGNDKLKLITQIRDADLALQNRDYRTLLKLIKPVISFLNLNQRRKIIKRIIYNDIYLQTYEPHIVSVPVEKIGGRFSIGSKPSIHQELGLTLDGIKNSLAATSKKRFHQLYGYDLSQTQISIRYSRAIGSESDNERGIDIQTQAENSFRDTNSNFLHFDEKKGLTTILYLSEVTSSNGAFRYVEGSHKAKISPILKAIHEFMLNDMKFTTHEAVIHYPPEFRAGINYYWWLEPEKRRIIDLFLKVHTGPAGTAISFAGNKLLHGGGIPYSGERSALFIVHVGMFSHRLRQLLHPLSILSRHGCGI
jgi:hypothetical protein